MPPVAEPNCKPASQQAWTAGSIESASGAQSRAGKGEKDPERKTEEMENDQHGHDGKLWYNCNKREQNVLVIKHIVYKYSSNIYM